MNTRLLLLLLATLLVVSCESKTKQKRNANSIKTESLSSCELLYANMEPATDTLISLVQEILDSQKQLSGDNRQLLVGLLKEYKFSIEKDSLSLLIEKPLFSIFRLKSNQIGVVHPAGPIEINGTMEDVLKEHFILKGNFGYQSVDSMGKLIYFPEEFTKLFNAVPPKIYTYSDKRKSQNTISSLAYYDDNCLAYYQYDFALNADQKTDKILFGSKLSLELEYGNYPSIDKVFKRQFAQNCTDCPTNYADQKTFAKLKGTDNIFFTYADSFPVNNKLPLPSRSVVLKKKDGSVITLWSTKLDLSGCGCF